MQTVRFGVSDASYERITPMSEMTPAPALRPPGQHGRDRAWNEAGRRRARFTFLMRRARATVEGDPKLTPDEWRELAAVYGQAAEDRAAS